LVEASSDAASGNWQLPMEPGASEMAAFVTKRGLYKPVVMPFGLTNAPATFQWMMDSMILDVKGKWAWIHIDDLLIYSPTWEEHLKHMEETFKCLGKEGITLKISKCKLVKAQLEYLGHIVSNDGVAPIPLEWSMWPIVQHQGTRRSSGS